MLEAILEAGYAPRVIIVEYNANFEISEAKSIKPPIDGEKHSLHGNNNKHVLKVNLGYGGTRPPTRACPSLLCPTSSTGSPTP